MTGDFCERLERKGGVCLSTVPGNDVFPSICATMPPIGEQRKATAGKRKAEDGLHDKATGIVKGPVHDVVLPSLRYPGIHGHAQVRMYVARGGRLKGPPRVSTITPNTTHPGLSACVEKKRLQRCPSASTTATHHAPSCLAIPCGSAAPATPHSHAIRVLTALRRRRMSTEAHRAQAMMLGLKATLLMYHPCVAS